MTMFEGWAKSCADSSLEIWELEATDEPETGLYMTKRSYWSGGNKFYYNPIYHVWAEGERVYCGESENDARVIYKLITDGLR